MKKTPCICLNLSQKNAWIPLLSNYAGDYLVILVILANLINLGQRVYGPCPYLCDLFTLVLRELCVLPILDNIIPPAHMGFSPLH